MVDGNLVHGVPGHDHVSKKQPLNKNRTSKSLLASLKLSKKLKTLVVTETRTMRDIFDRGQSPSNCPYLVCRGIEEDKG